MRRYSKSFAYTSIIYGALFGGIVLMANMKHTVMQESKEEIIAISVLANTVSQPMALSKTTKQPSPTQPNIPSVQPIITEPIIPQPIIAPSLALVQESSLKKPQAEVKPVVNLAPKESAIVHNIENTNSLETIQNKSIQIAQEKPLSLPKIAPKPTLDTKALKEQFYASLKAKIKQNQIYPLSAKRRGIQGIVEVKFVILSTGKVDKIQILSGNGIFKQSAIDAIENSFPITIPQVLRDEVNEVSLQLEYLIV